MFGMFPFLFNNPLNSGNNAFNAISNLTRMNPFMNFFNMDFIGGMVDEIFDSNFIRTATSEMMQEQSEYNVQMKEYDDYYMITGYLPGVSPKDIDIDFEKNKAILSIKNKRTYSNGKNAMMTIMQSGGDLEKNFYIGEVDVSKLAASFKNGQLILLIPKIRKVEATVVRENTPEIIDVDSYKVE